MTNKWDWKKKISILDTLSFNWKWYVEIRIKNGGGQIAKIERDFDDTAEYPFMVQAQSVEQSIFYFINDFDYFKFCTDYREFILGYGDCRR